MSTGSSGRVLGAALVAIGLGLGVSAVTLRAGDALEPPDVQAERLLYLRSGSAARRLMLSFDAVAADVYWMRAIQHYGRDRRSDRDAGRFELLAPLLDLTTSLDPQFNIAYRFGAIFLAEPPPSGPGRIDQAIALLKKGLAHNPDRWQYAFDIGFVYYWYGAGSAVDFDAAAQWFDTAAAMPDAPIWIRQLAAITRAQGGDTRGARRALQELATADEAWLRRAAARALDQLTAMDAIADLQRRADAYQGRTGRPAADWSGLLPDAPAGAAPVDPAGVPYVLDPATGRVSLSPVSPLAPLPWTSAPR